LRKRTLTSLLIALTVLLALSAAAYLRAKAPPEAARLLPESDAIVYIHLKDVRAATHFDQTSIARSADFQRFIDATGIVPERDIDSAAFALHRMDDPKGPNGPVAYSEVFIGRFDGVKLEHYLASIAAARETYAGRTIWTIPIEHRQLRIAQLSYDTIGASNMPTAEQIHSMLDRSRASALGTPGSSLLAARYHEVPLLSQIWGIGHVGLPFSGRGERGDATGNISIMGLQLPLPEDTDLVASLRYSGAEHLLSGGAAQLRIEEIAPDVESAQRTVETLTTLLNLVRGLTSIELPHGPNAQPPNPAAAHALQSILASVKITQKADRVLLNANAGLDDLKALAAQPGSTPSNLPVAFGPAPASK
jgi:hypothetical protein